MCDGLRDARSLAVRLLASLLLSALSFVFEGMFFAHLEYSVSPLGRWGVVTLVFFCRAGYVEMVADVVLGVRSRGLLGGLALGCLVYGVPSMILVDALGLSGFITPRFSWLHYSLLGLGLPPGLVFLLGLLAQSLVLDFPRLMLFVAVVGRWISEG